MKKYLLSSTLIMLLIISACGSKSSSGSGTVITRVTGGGSGDTSIPGIILDSPAGLMWKQQDNGGSNWGQASSYCAWLDLGGYIEWRLPTIEELLAIFQVNNVTGVYWSSSGSDTIGHWFTNAQSGMSGLAGDANFNSLCVKSYPPNMPLCSAHQVLQGGVCVTPEYYTNNGNGTITQIATGLMWQQQDDGVTRDWATAGTYCAGLGLGGYSGWRLPTKDELVGIVDTSYRPTINPIFTGTFSSSYWSSSNYADVPTYPLRVSFNDGRAYYSYLPYTSYARCVRLGQ